VIERNLQIVRAMSHVDLSVACVVSNLNLPILRRFMTWAEDEGYHWGISTVKTPYIFQPNNMPEPLLRTAQEKIRDFMTTDNHTRSVIEYLCAMDPLDDQYLWTEFCRNITLRDEFRNNSVFDLNPEFREHWVV
jgi:hypothetical protein